MPEQLCIRCQSAPEQLCIRGSREKQTHMRVEYIQNISKERKPSNLDQDNRTATLQHEDKPGPNPTDQKKSRDTRTCARVHAHLRKHGHTHLKAALFVSSHLAEAKGAHKAARVGQRGRRSVTDKVTECSGCQVAPQAPRSCHRPRSKQLIKVPAQDAPHIFRCPAFRTSFECSFSLKYFQRPSWLIQVPGQ